MKISRKSCAHTKRFEIKALICCLFLFHFLIGTDVSARILRSQSLPLVFDEQEDIEIVLTARWATSPVTGTFMYLTYQNAFPLAVAVGTPMLFNTQNVAQGNITYNPSTGAITLINTGYYRLSYGTLLAAPSIPSFKPRLNGVTLNVSNLFSYPATGNAISGGMDQTDFIFQSTTPNATLQIVNLSGAANNVYDGSYLIIEQIQ